MEGDEEVRQKSILSVWIGKADFRIETSKSLRSSDERKAGLTYLEALLEVFSDKQDREMAFLDMQALLWISRFGRKY